MELISVLVFMVCNLPRLALNLSELATHGTGEEDPAFCECDDTPTWFSIMISVNHLLLTVNRYTAPMPTHFNNFPAEDEI